MYRNTITAKETDIHIPFIDCIISSNVFQNTIVTKHLNIFKE